MEIEQEQSIENKIEQASKQTLGRGIIGSILILSFLAGSLSGFASSWYLLKSDSGFTSTKSVRVDEDSAVIDVVQEASPAVVSIVISKDINELYKNLNNNPFFLDPFFQFRQPENAAPNFQQTGAGSGFFISSDGLILTNKHVVNDEQAKYTVITNDGKQYEASVLSRDPVNDLALVKIEIKDAPTLKLADSAGVEIGQKVIAIGNSLGQFSNTVTTGIISGIGRNITASSNETGSEELENVLQTDAAINPGNSGGPLLTITGEVIGINTAVAQEGQLVGFAIPSNDALRAVASFDKFGKITRPFVGVRYVMINPTIKEANKLPVDEGAWISSGDASGSPIIAGSPAEKAGLKSGDIIVKIDGKEVNGKNSLAGRLKEYSPGDAVEFEIVRDGERIKLGLTLAENI
jgi:serine protease Do